MMEKLRKLFRRTRISGQGSDSFEQYYLELLKKDGVAPKHDEALDDYERMAAELTGWEPLISHETRKRDAVRPWKKK